MTTIDDRVPLGVECAWPLPAFRPAPPPAVRPAAWALLLAALRRALA